MGALKLSLQERMVLRCVQLSAELGAREDARATGISIYQVNYYLRKLRDQGFLIARPLVNLSALGYTEYHLYLRIGGSISASRGALLRWARNEGSLIEIVEVGGEFHFELKLVARSTARLCKVIDSLTATLARNGVEKVVSIQTDTLYFGTKLLSPVTPPVSRLVRLATEDVSVLDSLDQSILSELDKASEFSLCALARRLKIAPSTVEYRYHRLKRTGVLIGMYHDYNLVNQALGLQAFHVLIRLRGSTESFRKKFVAFCALHPVVDILVTQIGRWDYKLLLRITENDSVGALIDQLYARFDNLIDQIIAIPMLQAHAVRGLPSLDPVAEAAFKLQVNSG